MKFEEFKIGESFFGNAGFEWLCTDKGTRTVTAIMLDPDKDISWFKGPPYLLSEKVFDEYDILACYSNTSNMLKDRIEKFEKSSHPNYLAEDFLKMTKEKRLTRAPQEYPRKNLLKRDRVSKNGEILHPYTAVLKEKIWYVKIFEIFSREFFEMSEDDFKELKISTEKDMKERSKKFKTL